MTVRALQEALDADGSGTSVTSTTTTLVGTVDGPVAVVSVAPAALAARAGEPSDVYALGRVVRSEGYGGAVVGKAAAGVAIAQAVRNAAGAGSITAKLIRSKYPAAAGLYGEQSGRYASTRLDPSRWHMQLAHAVLDGDVPDLARGATMFLDPHVYVGGTQAGRALERFDAVMRRWHSVDQAGYGMAWVGPIPTVDAGHLMLFREESSAAAREASYRAALRIFDDVAAGRSAPAPGDPDASGGLLVALLTLALGAWAVLS